MHRALQIFHFAPRTLYLLPCIVHFRFFTLHLVPCTLDFSTVPCTLYLVLSTAHYKFFYHAYCTFHLVLCTSYLVLCTLDFLLNEDNYDSEASDQSSSDEVDHVSKDEDEDDDYQPLDSDEDYQNASLVPTFYKDFYLRLVSFFFNEKTIFAKAINNFQAVVNLTLWVVYGTFQSWWQRMN